MIQEALADISESEQERRIDEVLEVAIRDIQAEMGSSFYLDEGVSERESQDSCAMQIPFCGIKKFKSKSRFMEFHPSSSQRDNIRVFDSL